jgi:mycofactocin precursor
MAVEPAITEEAAESEPQTDDVVVEMLVEEVSIDGMCGVY